MANTKRNLLDAIDLKLVNLLLKDARASYKTLAAEVGLTSPACAERIRRLKEDGVIKGYRAEVDWARLGHPIKAVIRISAPAQQGKSLIKAFEETPNVIEVMRLTGADSYLVQILAKSSEELESVIDRIGSYGTVTTSLVLSVPLHAMDRVGGLLGADD
ncbi:Lrp/AsnC family transcriptional regulator [Pantoea sp. Tr-811]|uniref:Lrp/AsnC family transcriptional regulator n=1 Tax=Pantoea sp. Tr-811 TaxID=2608361 RepID=UPI00141E97D5|nr:Lrp/AsnC family transcriptional regulator [Pantoea sp. Tr-811]